MVAAIVVVGAAIAVVGARVVAGALVVVGARVVMGAAIAVVGARVVAGALVVGISLSTRILFAYVQVRLNVTPHPLLMGPAHVFVNSYLFPVKFSLSHIVILSFSPGGNAKETLPSPP